MSDKNVNVCLIGQKFMGRTHSNAYAKVPQFFPEAARMPVRHTICGRDREELEGFADQWGWQNASVDWRHAVAMPEIDLVDIGTPNHLHKDMALAALEAGKHVACEKPLAGTLAEAREMKEAAEKASGSQTFVWYNYRRCPALALAHKIAAEDRLGKLYHVRAVYLQDWGGPETPLLWRFKKELAGSGAHGDINAHIIDAARFVTGQEIEEVTGCLAPTFIKERTIPDSGGTGQIKAGSGGGGEKGESTVDDASLWIGKLDGGAICSFEASRLATGNQNKNCLEFNYEHGSLRWNFEDMNYLDFFDATLDRRQQGWTRIMATDADQHPYATHWWPDAHIIGYEHGFVNFAADMMNALGDKPPVVPMTDFADAYKTQQVLEAALVSAEERTPIKVADMK